MMDKLNESEKPIPTLAYASIEATLRGTNTLDNPEILAIFKAEFGFDPRRPQKFYDWKAVEVIERVLPEKLGWSGTASEKLFRLAVCTFEGWGETVLGRVLNAPLNKATAERAIELMARSMSLNPAFGEHELKKLSTNHYLFIGKNDPRKPEFVAGLLTPVLTKLGIEKYDWEVKRTGFQAYEIMVSW